MRVSPPPCDVAIAGAGPVGLILAATLAEAGLSVALIDPQSREALAQPGFDGREIALSQGSRQILTQRGLWSRLPAAEIAPLREALVMDGPAPRPMRVSALASGQPLGCLIANHRLREAAYAQAADARDIAWYPQAKVGAVVSEGATVQVGLEDGRRLGARVLVAADSRFSTTRRLLGIGAHMHDFGKSMLVCRMRHALPHHGAAWEWFGYGHTLALLPLNGDAASVVVTLPPQEMAALQALDDAAFSHRITEWFAHRLGPMQLESTRHVYPLVGVYAHRFATARGALVGDAAVGMHPVTAHGFNFGLLGADRLAATLIEAHRQGRDIGLLGPLDAYGSALRRQTLPLYLATQAVATLYTDDRAPARVVRQAALRLADAVTPFKRAIARRLAQPA